MSSLGALSNLKFPLPCSDALKPVGADGSKDEKDGYSIVVVQATGHHTGQAFSLPTVDVPAVRHTPWQACGQPAGAGSLVDFRDSLIVTEQ